MITLQECIDTLYGVPKSHIALRCKLPVNWNHEVHDQIFTCCLRLYPHTGLISLPECVLLIPPREKQYHAGYISGCLLRLDKSCRGYCRWFAGNLPAGYSAGYCLCMGVINHMIEVTTKRVRLPDCTILRYASHLLQMLRQFAQPICRMGKSNTIARWMLIAKFKGGWRAYSSTHLSTSLPPGAALTRATVCCFLRQNFVASVLRVGYTCAMGS